MASIPLLLTVTLRPLSHSSLNPQSWPQIPSPMTCCFCWHHLDPTRFTHLSWLTVSLQCHTHCKASSARGWVFPQLILSFSSILLRWSGQRRSSCQGRHGPVHCQISWSEKSQCSPFSSIWPRGLHALPCYTFFLWLRGQHTLLDSNPFTVHIFLCGLIFSLNI